MVLSWQSYCGSSTSEFRVLSSDIPNDFDQCFSLTILQSWPVPLLVVGAVLISINQLINRSVNPIISKRTKHSVRYPFDELPLIQICLSILLGFLYGASIVADILEHVIPSTAKAIVYVAKLIVWWIVAALINHNLTINRSINLSEDLLTQARWYSLSNLAMLRFVNFYCVVSFISTGFVIYSMIVELHSTNGLSVNQSINWAIEVIIVFTHCALSLVSCYASHSSQFKTKRQRSSRHARHRIDQPVNQSINDNSYGLMEDDFDFDSDDEDETSKPPVNHSTFSDIFFTWASPVIALGFRQGHLDATDVPDLLDSDSTTYYAHRFALLWKDEVHRTKQSPHQSTDKSAHLKNHSSSSTSRANSRNQSRNQSRNHLANKSRNPSRNESRQSVVSFSSNTYHQPINSSAEKPPKVKEPSLLRCFWRLFGVYWSLLGVLKFCNDLMGFVGPIILNSLVTFLSSQSTDQPEPSWHGFGYASALVLGIIVSLLLGLQSNYRSRRLSIRVRSALCSLIYSKSLSISPLARREFSAGEVTNLMSVDTERCMNVVVNFHDLWSLPVQITIACVLLAQQIGVGLVGGLGVILLLIPVNALLTKMIAKVSAELMKLKDERVALTNEMLVHIRVIKFLALDQSFNESINQLRQKELKALKKRKYLDAFCVYAWATTPILVALASFATFTLMGHTLTAAKAFTSLALFQILIGPLNSFPWVVNGFVEGRVSFLRCKKFLAAEDRVPSNSHSTTQSFNHSDTQQLLHSANQGKLSVGTAVEIVGTFRYTRFDDVSDHFTVHVPQDFNMTPVKRRKTSNADRGHQRSQTQAFSVSESIHQTPGKTPAHRSIASDSFGRSDKPINCPVNQFISPQRSRPSSRILSPSSSMKSISQPINQFFRSDSMSTMASSDPYGPFQLTNLALQIKVGEFVGIVGSVGSGKTSLLLAMLGELNPSRSSHSVINGRTAYVSQEAWIQNMSLRDNILFGSCFDKSKYDAVIDACALKPDLEQLPAGDETEIGEGGVNLSGGQRIRVAIARAVYADCDVYLFDDPIAAVDAHVASHLVEQLINGLLAHKTRILVTHQTDCLRSADKIITMKHGKIRHTFSTPSKPTKSAMTVSGELANAQQLNTAALSINQPTFEHSFPRASASGALSTNNIASENQFRNPSLYELDPTLGELHALSPHYDQTTSQILNQPSFDDSYDSSLVGDSGQNQNVDHPIDQSHSRLPVVAALASSELNTAVHVEDEYKDISSSQSVDDSPFYHQSQHNLSLDSDINRENPTDELLVGHEPDSTVLVVDQPALSRLTLDEARARGSIRRHVLSVYLSYVGWLLSLVVLLSMVLMQSSKNGNDWWLAHWAQKTESNNQANSTVGDYSRSLTDYQHTLNAFHPLILNLALSSNTLENGLNHHGAVQSDNNTSTDSLYYLKVLAIIAGLNSLFALFRAFVFAYAGLIGCQSMFDSLITHVINAPITFFDSHPVGRILNRFSTDTYSIDENIPFQGNIFLAQIFLLLGSLVIIALTSPFFLCLLPPLGILYYFIQARYRVTSRELRRLDSVTRSPLYSHFNETLTGVATIRAFGASQRFVIQFRDQLDENQRISYLSLGAGLWLNVRLQLIGLCIVSFLSFSAIILTVFRSSLPSTSFLDVSLVGLAIAYALPLTDTLNNLIGSFTDTEKEIVSVERTVEYVEMKTEQEIDEETNKLSKRRSANAESWKHWPAKGELFFDDVQLIYRTGLQPALDNVSFHIAGGEHIGVVGRTGSGKSSLFQVLFRIRPINRGRILIDGLDISQIPLHVVRSRLSIIPQSPVLFTGTVRQNIDVNGGATDDEIWQVLKQCRMFDRINQLPERLDSLVTEFASEFSVGERQLLCFGRALIKRSRLIVLDEASASLDAASDAHLTAVTESLKTQTVIVIAHRLQTVMNMDRILVMDNAHVVEFDTPANLLANPHSRFRSLYDKSKGGAIA